MHASGSCQVVITQSCGANLPGHASVAGGKGLMRLVERMISFSLPPRGRIRSRRGEAWASARENRAMNSGGLVGVLRGTNAGFCGTPPNSDGVLGIPCSVYVGFHVDGLKVIAGLRNLTWYHPPGRLATACAARVRRLARALAFSTVLPYSVVVCYLLVCLSAEHRSLM